MAYLLTEKLWYTSDRQTVVPDGDPRAAFLLGPAGHEISDAEAERLGLTGGSKAEPEKPNKGEAAPENKGVEFPPEKKRVKSGSRKK